MIHGLAWNGLGTPKVFVWDASKSGKKRGKKSGPSEAEEDGGGVSFVGQRSGDESDSGGEDEEGPKETGAATFSIHKGLSVREIICISFTLRVLLSNFFFH